MFLPMLPTLGIYSQTALAAAAAAQVQQVAATEIVAPDPLVIKLQSDGLDFSNGPAPNFFGQGRLGMIERHLQTVASGTPLHEVVVSTRRAGKTAFIWQSIAVARQQAFPNVRPVFAQMDGRDLKSNLYHEMWRATFGESSPTEEPDQLADLYFERLTEESKTAKIVIYIDEAGELHRADIQFFRRLRLLNDRVSVVFLSFVEDMSFHSQEVLQLGEGDASYSPSLNHFRWTFLPSSIQKMSPSSSPTDSSGTPNTQASSRQALYNPSFYFRQAMYA